MKYNTFLMSLVILISFFTQDLHTDTISVMPLVSKDELWDEELKSSDGVARLLTEALIRTKRFNVPDFDLLVAYFGAESIVIPYRELATNVDIATQFSKYAFSSDYIVMGRVQDFSVIISNKNEIASVDFDVNIIDVNTKEIITNISSQKTLKLPISTVYTNYTADDAIFTDTILGKATVMALNDIALQIGKALNTEISKGHIVRIENDMYFIDLGAYHGISLGDEFDIYDTRKILIHDISDTNALGTNALGTNALGTNALGTNALGTNTFGTNTFGTNALGTNALGTNTFGTNTFGTNALGTNALGTNALGTNALGTNALGTNTFGTNTFGTNAFGTNAFDTNAFGTNAFGTNAFGTNAFGTNAFGTNAFGTSALGTNTFGTNAFGTNAFDTNTFGTNTFGTNTFGTSAFGTNTFGTNTFGTNTFGTSALGTNSLGDDVPYSFVPIRTNKNGDIWFTSKRLYEYRIYEEKETYLTTAYVVELHDKYSVIKDKYKAIEENKEKDKVIELLMVAKLVYTKKPEDEEDTIGTQSEK